MTAVSTSHGSTRLTPEQQDWYQQRFGVRYTHIAQNQTGMNRKRRRSRRKRDLG